MAILIFGLALVLVILVGLRWLLRGVEKTERGGHLGGPLPVERDEGNLNFWRGLVSAVALEILVIALIWFVYAVWR